MHSLSDTALHAVATCSNPYPTKLNNCQQSPRLAGLSAYWADGWHKVYSIVSLATQGNIRTLGHREEPQKKQQETSTAAQEQQMAEHVNFWSHIE